ncbi:mucin-5AC [Eurosta solidaginis]|uniref:mucin-5AC n=1 Tax=Eurosta solidaginis TaxID=178769 RepID=UPI003530795E
MCTEVNSAMGLQATAATKRKHEITFEAKDTNTYTNSPPPLKTSKWSINNNNYIEAIEEHQLNGRNGTKDTSVNFRTMTTGSTQVKKGTIVNNGNLSSNTSSTNGLANSISNGKEVTKGIDHTNVNTHLAPSASASTLSSAAALPSMVASFLPMVTEIAATTPLPPTSTTPVPEDSIAKLEEVAAVPCCEPWTSAGTEPVDCISKLQAVAVPSDPWGGISTRSTLATTLLSADELDDDDDDFEDDYEEEESIIPTYCPLRYHSFPPPHSTSTLPNQQQRLGSYAPTPPPGYASRPNYYSEPYPQQNCSRTGSPQHMRMPGGNSFTQWQSTAGPSGGNQQFYVPPEAAYPSSQQQPPQQQQTIRCAENGKSYLELGCSSPPPTAVSVNSVVPHSPPPFTGMHLTTSLDARHPLKRCCDSRVNWCNTNKNCYKDIRLKIRNLSMFKLSRFRQVTEQSLYRSVLICNTLKRIDREIEIEAKEMHQAAAQAAAAQQQQYHQHLHPPHHLQHHLIQQQTPPQLLVPQQPHTLLHQQHQDYVPPVMNCSRVSNMEYQVQQPQTLLQQQTPPHHFTQHLQLYQNQPDRLETPPPSYTNTPAQQLQKSSIAFAPQNNSPSSINMNNCDSTTLANTSTSTTLHPYDHYPFRESQSGRATPYPCQPSPTTSSPTSSLIHSQLHPATATISAPTMTASPQLIISTAAPASTANIIITTPHTSTTTSVSTTDSSDSGYGDDDSTRSINWSSVLSLSSQSALDPLNNNDLFAILPPALSITSPATATPVPVTAATTISTSAADSTTQTTAVSISGTFTTVQSTSASSTNTSESLPSNSSAISNNTCTSSSTATFTTLSTISSATHSLTSSYVSSISANAAAASASSTWEYGFLDMEFGLGSEFTELVPSCKLSSDDLFKNSLTPVAASRYSSVHDNELEQPAHIMVGS